VTALTEESDEQAADDGGVQEWPAGETPPASTDAADIVVVLGTRPEIIKLGPVIRECDERGFEPVVVHTGQHYSESLDAVFFDQLDLPAPTYHLEVGSGSHATQTGRMLARIERVLLGEEPDVVVVQGDTNSTLAGGLAASKLDCRVAHVEAGLRSGDWSMPEEVNRVLVDHAADHVFAPTTDAAENLAAEGIARDAVAVTGNTVVDALYHGRRLASERSSVLDDLGLEAGEFCLLTAHRAENVDDPERFAALLEGVGRFAADRGLEVVYPIHPRAAERLEAFDLEIPALVRPVEPLDFLSFVGLETAAAVAFTDSGGVQEETCVLGTPCVTLRDSTERPETIEVGANTLAGVDPAAVDRAAREMLARTGDWSNPFGDGRAAERIVDALVDGGPHARARARDREREREA
jgi:UDP-N-acetylglucosamine 2-epimerase (non-hydrolysing)